MTQLAIRSYEWRDTPGWKWIGDAEEIGRHIEAIAEDKAGFITTQDIVNDARDLSSPLHPNFEWDDLKAAENWREQTARALVGSLISVKVRHAETEGEPTEIRVRAFVNVEVEGQHYYSPISVIVQHANLYEQHLKRLYQEAQSWRRKASDFREFAGVVSVISELPPLDRLLVSEVSLTG